MASQSMSSTTAVDGPERSGSRRFARAGLLVVGLVMLALVAVLSAALVREAGTPASTSKASPVPPRKALTTAEEAYAQALWVIHGDVKRAAYTLTFSGMRYKLKEADAHEFETGVLDASQHLEQAEARVRALAAPPSLGAVHAQYLDAVDLFRQSAAEMLKATADPGDDHLLTAYPLSQKASENLLRVADVIWPGEYLPN
jgi:hypothetical protein